MKTAFLMLVLASTCFAWPPVDVPQSDRLHYFAAVSGPVSGSIREEIRFAANVPPNMQSDSGRYFTMFPAVPTPYNQPFPYRAPIAVHILRVVNGNPVMGWVAHVRNYMFEYYQRVGDDYRFSLRIQTDDDLPGPVWDRDKPQKRAIRNFHIVREQGRWGFSERMGLNPYEGGRFAALDEILGVSDDLNSVLQARPPVDLGDRMLRLASDEAMLWSDENPPLMTKATCAQRLGLRFVPGIPDSSWMFKNKDGTYGGN